MDKQDFRQIVESVKLRVPVEDVVRERVPELKRSGSVLAACCPFHEERTPSFKVDPRRGTWHCFGACGTGGDVISFVQQFDGVGFPDAIETLAARAGVELPDGWRGSRRDADQRFQPLYSVLARAEKTFRRYLAGEAGEEARAYFRTRGLEPGTLEAFGVGFAPPRGNHLLEAGRREGESTLRALEAAGLVRTTDGRSYDFFRGRLMIPIRDLEGRTVGFGGRRLNDDEGGPKYVNTPETPVFHKGRLVYGLDRALPAVRRERHLFLVEGYTDVMAAHQVGLSNVAAVLGTATTDDHAGLVRRTGARHVSLVFDGDDAGRRATLRALAGLLPLAVDIDVVRLPGGEDPCDLLVRSGASGITDLLDGATPWLDFCIEGLRGLQGSNLSDGVDELLRVVQRLQKPVHRDSCLQTIARELELSADAVRNQARGLAARTPRRGDGPAAALPARDGGSPATPDASPGANRDASTGSDPGSTSGGELEELDGPAVRRQEIDAYRDLAGAVLVDNSLVPAVAEHFEACPEPRVAKVLGVVHELYETAEDDDPIDASRVMTVLAGDPARDVVVPLEARARAGESTRLVAEGAVECLRKIHARRKVAAGRLELSRADDDQSRSEVLLQIWREHRRVKVPPSAATEPSAPPS